MITQVILKNMLDIRSQMEMSTYCMFLFTYNSRSRIISKVIAMYKFSGARMHAHGGIRKEHDKTLFCKENVTLLQWLQGIVGCQTHQTVPLKWMYCIVYIYTTIKLMQNICVLVFNKCSKKFSCPIWLNNIVNSTVKRCQNEMRSAFSKHS